MTRICEKCNETCLPNRSSKKKEIRYFSTVAEEGRGSPKNLENFNFLPRNCNSNFYLEIVILVCVSVSYSDRNDAET